MIFFSSFQASIHIFCAPDRCIEEKRRTVMENETLIFKRKFHFDTFFPLRPANFTQIESHIFFFATSKHVCWKARLLLYLLDRLPQQTDFCIWCSRHLAENTKHFLSVDNLFSLQRFKIHQKKRWIYKNHWQNVNLI